MDGKRHIITIAAIGPDSGADADACGVYDALRQARRACCCARAVHGVADRLRQRRRRI